MTSDIPHEWKCPITHEIMIDPVMASDGFTYERSAIERWLINSNKSPMTNEIITKETLKLNINLRNLIQKPTDYKSKKIDSTPYVQTKVISNYNLSSCENGNVMIHFDLSSEEKEKENRNPVCIICVIDISGSMDIIDELPNKKEYRFTRLNLVQHAMKVLIAMLGDDDYLSIILFNNSAHILLPYTAMNIDGHIKSNNLVDNIKAEYATNIWDGLRVAIDLINDQKEICKNINTFPILFTDGESNINPLRSIEETLSNYIKKNLLKCPPISTIGFSNDVNSHTLNNIAAICGGTFVFIPDVSMVGTVIVNLISSCLSCMHAKLKFELETNGTIIRTLGNTDIGMFQYGQSRDIIFEVKPPCNNFKIKYSINDETVEVEIDKETISSSTINNETKVQLARLYLVDNLRLAIDKPILKAQSIVQDIQSKLESMLVEVDFDPRIVEIIKDFKSTNRNEAQISKAVSDHNVFKKWGEHYILSIANAHDNKQCNNFKDPGVQFYGGSLFRKIREFAEEIFCNLPPPKPSTSPKPSKPLDDDDDEDGIVYRSLSCIPDPLPPPLPPVNSMCDYYDQTAGCFGGNSSVHIQGNKFKPVSKIKKGDILSNDATVICVIKIYVTSGKKEMVYINDGLLITMWHPILINKKWTFPGKRIKPSLEEIDTVYNFVLDSKHIITINDIECCTLGHNFIDNDVIKHPYYGTNEIINDLSKINGWDEGKITINDNQFIRENSLVSGINL